MKLIALALLITALHGLALGTPISPEEAISSPKTQVESALPESHPAVLYAYAKRLFEEGHRDEAVMWFYAGQLRYRFHLRANPSLPRDGEPALMASLNATVGRTINEWAGGSPKQWAAAVDKALAWDLEHENATTSKQQSAKAWEDTRKGLADLRDKILANEVDIRADRTRNGLENR